MPTLSVVYRYRHSSIDEAAYVKRESSQGDGSTPRIILIKVDPLMVHYHPCRS